MLNFVLWKNNEASERLYSSVEDDVDFKRNNDNNHKSRFAVNRQVGIYNINLFVERDYQELSG